MPLSREEIVSLFRKVGTMREGHFLLTSGRHSDTFFLMPHTFQSPEHASRLCADLAAMVADLEIDTVVGPATGGIILAYEVARQIGLLPGDRKAPRAIFTEKTDGGEMALKRQWSLQPGEKVLMVEDAITTGGSVFKAIEAIKVHQPNIVGVACIADRSGGRADFGVPLRSVITLQVDSWAANECPLCKAGVPLTKPKA